MCCSPVLSINQLGLAITGAAGVNVSTRTAFGIPVERCTLQVSSMLAAGVSCSKPRNHPNAACTQSIPAAGHRTSSILQLSTQCQQWPPLRLQAGPLDSRVSYLNARQAGEREHLHWGQTHVSTTDAASADNTVSAAVAIHVQQA